MKLSRVDWYDVLYVLSEFRMCRISDFILYSGANVSHVPYTFCLYCFFDCGRNGYCIFYCRLCRLEDITVNQDQQQNPYVFLPIPTSIKHRVVIKAGCMGLCLIQQTSLLRTVMVKSSPVLCVGHVNQPVL